MSTEDGEKQVDVENIGTSVSGETTTNSNAGLFSELESLMKEDIVTEFSTSSKTQKKKKKKELLFKAKSGYGWPETRIENVPPENEEDSEEKEKRKMIALLERYADAFNSDLSPKIDPNQAYGKSLQEVKTLVKREEQRCVGGGACQTEGMLGYAIYLVAQTVENFTHKMKGLAGAIGKTIQENEKLVKVLEVKYFGSDGPILPVEASLVMALGFTAFGVYKMNEKTTNSPAGQEAPK